MRHGAWIALACALCLSASAYTYGLHRHLEGRVDALLTMRTNMAQQQTLKTPVEFEGEVFWVKNPRRKVVEDDEPMATWLARHRQAVADLKAELGIIED